MRVSGGGQAQTPPEAATTAGVGAVPEDPWRLLARLQPDAAVAAAAGRNDALAVWIRAVAAMRNASAEPATASGTDPTAAVARAAGAFEAKDFTTCLAILDSLATVAALPAGPTQAGFLAVRRGVCQLETGLIDEAEATLTAVLAVATPETAPVLRCYALLSRGRERVRTRQVEPPRQDLVAARELALELDIPSWAGTAAIALSVVSRLQMDLDDALQWRQQALADYRRAGDVTGQARALHYIATIWAMQGDLTRSLTMLQEALVLARQDENPAEVGGILGEMAGINYLLGNFDQALTEYEEAARLVAHPWRRGMMLSNMGSIHEYRGHLDAAAEVLAEARDLLSAAGDKRSEALALTTLGKTLCAEQDFNAGLAALNEALTLAREFQIPMAEAYALATRGHGLLAKGDLRDAATALVEATEVARRIDYFDVLEWSLLGQAQVARRLGRPDTALVYLEEALAEVAERRRRSSGAAAVTGGIVRQAGRLYNETVDLLYELHTAHPDRGLDDRAFAVAQRAKGRAFLDLLTEAEYDLRYSAVPGYREQEGEILRRIVDLEETIGTAETTGAPPDTLGRLQAELAGAETELRLLEAQLRQAEPRYAEVLYPAALTRATLATEVLAPGEVFLDYALGDSASYLWAVDREQTAFLQLPPRAEIDAQVREVLPLLTDYNLTGDDPAWYQPAAHELYRILLQPAAAYLERAERLIISPDGILHYLPFEALPADAEPVRRFRDVPYLIRDVEIGYTPTAGVLARLRSSRPETAVSATETWLLVGDPVLQADDQAGVFARAAGATDLPPLPHAAAELASLAEVGAAGAGAGAGRRRRQRCGPDHSCRRVPLQPGALCYPWSVQRGTASLFGTGHQSGQRRRGRRLPVGVRSAGSAPAVRSGRPVGLRLGPGRDHHRRGRGEPDPELHVRRRTQRRGRSVGRAGRGDRRPDGRLLPPPGDRSGPADHRPGRG